jgi:arsenate reductase
MPRKKVLFTCTHNSARSPMAEGFLRSLYGDRYHAYSAGIDPREVDPFAVKVMAEKGIDISHHKPKSLKDFWCQEFDVFARIRDPELEPCTCFPGGRKKRVRMELQDPVIVEGTEEEKMKVFRQARDELESWIVEAFGK